MKALLAVLHCGGCDPRSCHLPLRIRGRCQLPGARPARSGQRCRFEGRSLSGIDGSGSCRRAGGFGARRSPQIPGGCSPRLRQSPRWIGSAPRRAMRSRRSGELRRKTRRRISVDSRARQSQRSAGLQRNRGQRKQLRWTTPPAATAVAAAHIGMQAGPSAGAPATSEVQAEGHRHRRPATMKLRR